MRTIFAHLNPAQLHALIVWLEALIRHAHPRGIGQPVSCGPRNVGTPGYLGPCS